MQALLRHISGHVTKIAPASKPRPSRSFSIDSLISTIEDGPVEPEEPIHRIRYRPLKPVPVLGTRSGYTNKPSKHPSRDELNQADLTHPSSDELGSSDLNSFSAFHRRPVVNHPISWRNDTTLQQPNRSLPMQLQDLNHLLPHLDELHQLGRRNKHSEIPTHPPTYSFPHVTRPTSSMHVDSSIPCDPATTHGSYTQLWSYDPTNHGSYTRIQLPRHLPFHVEAIDPHPTILDMDLLFQTSRANPDMFSDLHASSQLG